ncbi:MAG TPA: efflux RND transporter periplasmic adaptor subunit [Candidatus Sulfotelmatobacter sp.]|nr:efflux RND transporter periplasmic adaptor subunit [Candidatus Sulfotelmatobacter sp.]
MRRLIWVAIILAAIGLLAVGAKRVLDERSGGDPPAAELARVARRDVGPVVKATGAIKPMVGAEVRVGQQSYGVASQQYRQAQANLADAVTQLGYARIISPIAGTVESVTTQEGETVASSFAAPTFVTLLDLSRLEVWAYVDETDIGRIRLGQKATFTVDTYGDDQFPGEVTAVYPQAQIRDNVVDYIAVIHFRPLPGHILRPEMTTTVTIAQQQHRNVLALPISAVHREGGRQYVIVQNGPSTERHWITTGLRDDSYWEILSGVREGEGVLIGNSAKQ